MKLQTIALALAVAAGGITATQAFAQDSEVSVTQERPDGALVTKHIRSDESGVVHKTVRVMRPDGALVTKHVRSDEPGVVHKTVRVTRPDGSTVVRRVTRTTTTGYGYAEPHRTVVIHHRYTPERHVIVRDVDGRPGYVENRRVTVIHDAG